jgi:beta-galactosidase
VALLADDESGWALEQGLKPHRALRYAREPRLWHGLLWDRNVLVDVLPADAPIDGYDLVIVPTLFVADAALGSRLGAYVAAGGTALVTYLSGIVDRDSRVIPGGYPGAFRDWLGVWTEEFRPLQRDESVHLDDGSTVVEWTEDTVLAGASAVLRYLDGDSVGRAAVTRHRHGDGTAWYVGAHLTPESAARVLDQVVAGLDLRPVAVTSPGVEAVRRLTDDGGVLFLLNHTDADAEVQATGVDLVTGATVGPRFVLPAGACAVLAESAEENVNVNEEIR